jgi:hypothetical protein
MRDSQPTFRKHHTNFAGVPFITDEYVCGVAVCVTQHRLQF